MATAANATNSDVRAPYMSRVKHVSAQKVIPHRVTGRKVEWRSME